MKKEEEKKTGNYISPCRVAILRAVVVVFDAVVVFFFRLSRVLTLLVYALCHYW